MISPSPPYCEDLKCGFCDSNLQLYTVPQREQHYEIHFVHQAGNTNSSTSSELPVKYVVNSHQRKDKKWARKAKSILQPAETDIFWHLADGGDPPPCYTLGLIPLLRQALWKAHSRGELRRAALCYERAVHVSREPWDSMWGCGYRNFLMSCIALMDQPFQKAYSALLSSPVHPSIRNLQCCIEDAWAAGFDEIGAKQLKKLVGTKKWIGTGDLWVAFVFRGIPVELVDFDLRQKNNGPKAVLDWIVNYFTPSVALGTDVNDALSKASPIVTTERMPLVLQYNGHSRTIIGYQINKKGQTCLLTFDPSRVVSAEVRKTAMQCFNFTDSSGSWTTGQKRGASEILSTRIQKCMKPEETNGTESSTTKEVDFKDLLKRFIVDDKAFRSKDQYQILYFPMTNPLTESERLGRKIVTSTKMG
ncbi:peptidase family C78-domain-containing protein [Cyathus striatus]|nr:peptidase family C78-domain-containing protein [Cyathus striatus]